MKKQYQPWFRVALQIRGSVIPAIAKQVIVCGGFAVLISLFYAQKYPVSLSLGSFLPSVGIVLGLLLVFRTNTAYDRFWEGRRLWGSIIINSTNLARRVWVAVEEIEPGDREKKNDILRLIAAFSVAVKLNLRTEPLDENLKEFISPSVYSKLKTAKTPPLEIVVFISEYLQQQANRKALDPYQLPALQNILDEMVGSLKGCQRILRTPIPFAYAIHLKQLLLIYCLLLPFQLVKDLQWWTGPIVALISFTVFGIEAIGLEIENPFGYDTNDLPLDNFCATIRGNIEDLITLTPGEKR
jgi:putative membrane protein